MPVCAADRILLLSLVLTYVNVISFLDAKSLFVIVAYLQSKRKLPSIQASKISQGFKIGTECPKIRRLAETVFF